MSEKAKKRDHYTIGDALVILFSNPMFYFILMVFGIAWMLRGGT